MPRNKKIVQKIKEVPAHKHEKKSVDSMEKPPLIESVTKFKRKEYRAKTHGKSNYWTSLRISKNIKLKDIGERLGVSETTAGLYFRGYILPTKEKIRILCDWFEVDYDKGCEEFEKIFSNWGAAHPGYINQSGVWRTPTTIERHKQRSKKGSKITTPVTQKPYKAWTKVDNFWAKQRVAHDITLEELADKLGRHTLTVRAYFTGHMMPPQYVISYLCREWGINFDEGYREFKKAHEEWGAKHPNYVKYGNTWVTKGSIEKHRARDNVRHMHKCPPNTNRPYWKYSNTYDVFCKYIYNNLSYDDYKTATDFNSFEESLSYLYGKVDEDIYLKCRALLNSEIV